LRVFLVEESFVVEIFEEGVEEAVEVVVEWTLGE
jgi:hypothetical protein